MRYWWVNQNRHEVAGGYLWSPKRKANGGVNPFYESMREVAPGDIAIAIFRERALEREQNALARKRPQTG
jgi:hypothetical protein